MVEVNTKLARKIWDELSTHAGGFFFGLPLDNEPTPAPPKWAIPKFEEIRSAHSEK
jgi:hypothetical protein